MPLFMDIHIIDSETLVAEDVARAHVQDLNVEKKYGVQQLKYWVDTTNKKVFCLMRGPNREACHAVHRESHGMTACNIVEVTEDESRFLLLGRIKNDLAYAESDDVLDTGFRTLLRLDVFQFCAGLDREELTSLIVQQNGYLLPHDGPHTLAYFHHRMEAIGCARFLTQALQRAGGKVEYQIGLTTGQLLDRHSSLLFEAAKRDLRVLAHLGMPNVTFVDRATNTVLPRGDAPVETSWSLLSERDLAFLSRALAVVEAELASPALTVARFNQLMGLSKASAYRAVKSLLNLSPGALITNIRLRRALQLLREDRLSISEITYEVGFNSPSYFSRVFKQRFGHSPSEWIPD
ncbi:nickel-binding protein [Lewinella sp. JB7]|uniref:nickel-binding protein n=1 Tax=Lewinella sp. JB7 TaxID=2962887 RepID=UPI0020CA0483|nr:nickel-binding protein [Lewinella sp. JB7]MCP9237468.1 DUF4242 domain-containing protein [Lewinella sp. JB7]